MTPPRRLFGRFALDFPDHPKILPLSDAAFRCHVEAVLWSRKQQTDGFLPKRLAVAKWSLEVLRELCCNDTEKPSLIEREDGWYIHDFAEEQDTRAVIEARREQAKTAGKQGGLATSKRTAKRTASKPVSETVSKNLAETETKTGGLSLVPARHDAPLVDAEEPPRQCRSHINDPTPPPCGRCAEARKSHEAWTAAARDREAARRAAIRAAIDACDICDHNGHIETRNGNAVTICQHREAANA